LDSRSQDRKQNDHSRKRWMRRGFPSLHNKLVFIRLQLSANPHQSALTQTTPQVSKATRAVPPLSIGLLSFSTNPHKKIDRFAKIRIITSHYKSVEWMIHISAGSFTSFRFFKLPTYADTRSGSASKPCFLSCSNWHSSFRSFRFQFFPTWPNDMPFRRKDCI
jgi:hypothetical protein